MYFRVEASASRVLSRVGSSTWSFDELRSETSSVAGMARSSHRVDSGQTSESVCYGLS